MKRVVADASFCGAWILPDETSVDAAALLEEIECGAVALVVPSLWLYEMGNLVKSACRRKRLTETAARSAQELVGQVPLALCDVPSPEAGEAILELSLKHDLSAYDGSYLELAKRLKTPLRTADQKLRAAAMEEGIDVVAG